MKTYYNLPQVAKFPLAISVFFTLFSFTLYGQITNIPDPNFEQALIDLGIDSDGIVNGQVLTSDINTVQELDIRFKNINNLTGIEDFAALEDLNIRGNNLTSIDTSQNTLLRVLICNTNPLTTMNLSNNLFLESLEIIGLHQLNNIDLSNNINLETLNMVDCWIDAIDISNNANLKTFIAGGVSFSEIDLSNNLALEHLDVTGVHLNELDISNNVLLKELYCGNYGGDIGQEISVIDLSNNVDLEIFYAENLFLLETLDAKNGNNAILNITLPCEFEGVPCELTELDCVKVDDEATATNDDPPYDSWYIAANFVYSEDCILGISEKNNELFSIHPNPAKSKLFLSSKNTIQNLKIKIFNLESKLLSTQSIVLQDQKAIDVSQLVSGIYFLNIEEENGNTTTKKFIKQ